MTKHYSGLIKIITVLLALVIIAINLYALVNTSTSFPINNVTDILFILVFASIGIGKVKDGDKYGHIYLSFTLVMAIILVIKFITKII